jgi:hypothetical protein
MRFRILTITLGTENTYELLENRKFKTFLNICLFTDKIELEYKVPFRDPCCCTSHVTEIVLIGFFLVYIVHTPTIE